MEYKTRFVVFAVISLIWLNMFEIPDKFSYKSTIAKHTPNIQRFTDFLNPDQCQYLTDKLKTHPENVAGGGLGEGFTNVTGFTVIFKNKDLAQRLIVNDLKLQMVWDIFERVTLPDSNAFVINTLVIKASDISMMDDAVSPHYDNTIDVESGVFNRDLLARFINIIYVNCPKDIIGGEFVAYEKGISNVHEFSKPLGLSSYIPLPTPVVYQKPINGNYLKVRGDLCHKVNSFGSKVNDVRISLVIEEYMCNDTELSVMDEITIRSKRNTS